MADDPENSDVEPEVEPAPEPTIEPEIDEQDDDYTPPTRDELAALKKQHDDALAKARTEQEKTVAALKKANSEATKRRLELAEIQKQHEDDETKAKREATEAAMAAMKPALIKGAAHIALMKVDAKPDRLDRLFRMLDLTKIDFDGDEVVGLEDQVEELKAEVPELFGRPEPEKPEAADIPEKTRPAAAQLGTRKPTKSALSPMELLAAQIEKIRQ